MNEVASLLRVARVGLACAAWGNERSRAYEESRLQDPSKRPFRTWILRKMGERTNFTKRLLQISIRTHTFILRVAHSLSKSSFLIEPIQAD